jgi:hypothetical protein
LLSGEIRLPLAVCGPGGRLWLGLPVCGRRTSIELSGDDPDEPAVLLIVLGASEPEQAGFFPAEQAAPPRSRREVWLPLPRRTSRPIPGRPAVP